MRVDLTKVDCRLAVEGGDEIVSDLPLHINCPEHEVRIGKQDSTASLGVYSDHLHCFGCGFHIYRRIDTLAYLLRVSVPAAIRVAGNYTSDALDAYRERTGEKARREHLPSSLAQAYLSLLCGMRQSRMKWLEDRGLKWETILHAMIGHDSTRFTIPFFDYKHRLITIRFRRDDEYGVTTFDDKPIPKYSGMTGRNGLYLYPEWLLASSDPNNPLVIVEGELDALLLWQEGIQAVSTTNGAGNMPKVIKLLEEFYQQTARPRFTRLLICGDMDEPGQKASEMTMDLAKQSGYGWVEKVVWTEQAKDTTELYNELRRNRNAFQDTIYGRY